MRIPDSKIAEVAAAVNIVEVISDYVELKRAGKDFRGLCPFHGDKDPSFYVSPQKEIFHCFGCHTGGSVFSFLMKMENVSFAEAVRKLAGRYGVPFEYERIRKSSDDPKEKLLDALKTAQRYFREQLAPESSSQTYLRGRGVSREWADRLGLGYAPDSWAGLCDFLRRAGIDESLSVAAGLVRPRTSGGYYDYFRSRIMIPILDLSNNLVAFGGRAVGDADPKYLNSPESSVFRKRSILYGLESARHAIRTEGYILLVEGYFDQISLRIRGLENVVAPLGTALGSEQIRLAKRFADRMITVFDADEAGIRAVKRSIPLFLAEEIEPWCVILSEHKDPDEAVNKVGIDGFRKMLDAAVPMIDFFLDRLEAQYDLRTLHGKNLAVEDSLPILREIADSKEGDYLIERFCSRIRMREDRLRKLISSGKHKRNGGREPSDAVPKSLFDFPPDERNVVRGMLLREGIIERVCESGVVKDLQEPLLRSLAEAMISFRERNNGFDAPAFCRSLEDDKLASIVAGFMQPKREEDDLRPEVEGDQTIADSIDRIRLRKLEARKAEIMERMMASASSDEERRRLWEEVKLIKKQLPK